MIEALDHIIIAVEDIEAAEKSYEALLGRTASWEGGHPDYGTKNVLFRLDNTYLELLAPDGDTDYANLLRSKIKEGGEGPMGLAFGTKDADQTVEVLEAAGLHPQTPMPGTGVDRRSGATRQWRNVMLPGHRVGGLFMFAIEHESDPDTLPLVPPHDTGGGAVHAVDHVVIQTQDPEAAKSLYGEEGLGLRLALDQTVEKWGGRMLFFRVGGLTVEVVGKTTSGEVHDKPTHSFWGIAYKVEDIDAAHDRLKAAGVDVSEVRVGRKEGTKVATVKSHVHGVPTLLIGPA